MGQKSFFLSLLLLFSAIVFLMGRSVMASIEIKDTIDQKSKELNEITEQIQAVNTNLSGVQSQKNSLQKELKSINASVQKLNLGIRSSEVLIQKLNLEVDVLHQEIRDLEEKIDAKQKAIGIVLRELRVSENETPLLTLFRTKSLSESLADMQSLSDLNASLVLSVGELKRLQGELDGTFRKTSEKKDQVQEEHGVLKQKKNIVEEEKEEKNTLLRDTKNREATYQKQLAELEERQEQISKEIEELERKLRASFDTTQLLPHKGTFSKPVKTGVLTQEYGETEFAQRAYRSRFHNGIDYGLEIGTPIYAVARGKVLAIDNNDRGISRFQRYQYGKYVMIQHENGLTTLYAHLSKNNVVVEGQTVERGELIGYSGNTGYATGPHLHFTVYWSSSIKFKSIPPAAGLVPVGVTVNPLDYL